MLTAVFLSYSNHHLFPVTVNTDPNSPTAPETITLDMVREHLFTAVISDALDSSGYPEQSLPNLLLPMTGTTRLVGRCRTTLWEDIDFEDPNPYELELKAVDGCQPEDVIIAAAEGSTRSGIWGELLSTAARNRGCVGAIVHGAVRDIEQMREMKFPVFASSSCPYDSLNRQRVTAVDVPVTIAGLTFNPGDLVVADEDGLVVVPAKVEREVIGRAWEKVHAESVTRDAIRNGMTATEVYQKYGVL